MNEKKNYNDYNLDLVIIDHLSLINTSNSKDSYKAANELFEKISRERNRILKNKERKEKLETILKNESL